MSAFVDNAEHIARMKAAKDLQRRVRELRRDFVEYRYTYNFQWLGRPIIQLPEDVMAIQELVWRVRPKVIVETGIAHGGSLVFSASLLQLLGEGDVIGVDVDIREHNRKEIEANPMAHRIQMIEGSSIDAAVVQDVRARVAGRSPVVVLLDSNHTHDHVLAELRMYGPLVSKGSYIVVLDTAIEDLPEGMFPDRPWSKANNPKTAVREFLQENVRFEVDRQIEDKLIATGAPEGYLKCVAD